MFWINNIDTIFALLKDATSFRTYELRLSNIGRSGYVCTMFDDILSYIYILS